MGDYPSVGRSYPCDAKRCPALRESAIGPLPCECCADQAAADQADECNSR